MDFARVKDLVIELRGLARDERRRRLDQVCADDDALRREAESLLSHGDDADGFLQKPALADGSAILHRAMSEKPVTASIPESLGQYRIFESIGSGGMATVYRAEQDHPMREVALKLMRRQIRSRSMLRRFRLEVEILGRLQHPGIAQIYDAGTFDSKEGSQPYFSMELVRGKSLTEHAECGRLSARERLSLFARVCDAVEHAHQKGVVHRDLKPENILVQENGDPKVLDFGVARATDIDLQVTTMRTDIGQVIGTVPYMSPEQVTGSTRDIDTRTDVYALGVVLYQLLSGRLPHTLDHCSIAEAARIIQDDEPTRLSSVSAVFRGDVDTIVAKAIEKDPGRRYQSAEALAADIRHHLNDEPILARRASTFYQLHKFVRRNRALVGGVAVAFAAMFVGTIVALWQTQLARGARQEAEFEAYLSKITGASAAIAAEDPATARSLLASADPTMRNWEWKYLYAQLDQSIVVIKGDTADAFAGVAFSKDGSAVLTVTRDGRLERRDAQTGQVRSSLALGANQIKIVMFSEDRSLVVGLHGEGQKGIGLWNTIDGRPVRMFESLDAIGEAVAISPDGRCVAAGMVTRQGNLQGISVWQTTGDQPGLPMRIGDLFHECKFSPGITSNLFFSPDSKTLIACGVAWGAGGVFFYDPITANSIKNQGAAGPPCAALTHDSLLAVSLRKRIELRDVETRQRRTILTGHKSTITAVAFSHDGSLLASGDGQSVRVWDVARERGQVLLTGHTGRIRQVSFNHDGSRLLSWSADGTVRIWLVSDVDPTTVLREHESYVYAVDFSPDGTHLVTGGWDGKLRVWDAAGGELLTTLATAHAATTGALYTPHERFIVSAAKSTLQLWDADTGALMRSWCFQDRSRTIRLIVSAEGLLAGTSLYHVKLWRPARHDRPISILARGVKSKATFSPDGGQLAVGAAASILVADTVTGEIIRTWAAPRADKHSGLAWSPDGAILATGHADNTIRLWDARTGAALAVLEAHSGPVYDLVFSSDGSRLVSGSEDTTIRIWDVASRREVLELRGHDDYVFDLAFSPDGSRLASASGDTTARIWDTRPLHERWFARKRMRALREEMAPLVDSLIEEMEDQGAVARTLRADTTLERAGRVAALQVLLQHAAPRADDCSENGRADIDDLAEGTGSDCDGNGWLDACDIATGSATDANGNGVPDKCEDCKDKSLPVGRGREDCDGNGWVDVCDIATGRAADINANGIPDKCEDCNGNDLPDSLDIDAGTCDDQDGNGFPDECDRHYPTTLAGNTTGQEGTKCTGAPDDIWISMGGQRVTYDLDGSTLVDGPGPDFNIYELDRDNVEFDRIDVLVSLDGTYFVSVKASEGPVIPLPLDQAHGHPRYARSYDLGPSKLSTARFVRIEGFGDASGGRAVGFDLDAVGLINLAGPDGE